MGNLLCLMAHCYGRGEELIIGSNQHVYLYEQGHFMRIAGIGARVLPNQPDGSIDVVDIRTNIRDATDFHQSETKLICLENTHMNCGGIPLTNKYLKEVGSMAQENNIKLHIDGARLFNAAVATNQSLSSILSSADSVSMCLSKGLGCPVGSIIGGSEELISKALRIRKSLGGGIRQGGFLAAAGLYALEHGHIYIQRDHSNARLLAEGVNQCNSDLLNVDLDKVKTNIVFCDVSEDRAFDVERKLREKRVLAIAFSESRLRFVLHHDVSEKDVQIALLRVKEVIFEVKKITEKNTLAKRFL